jgi:hypothetical protein
MASTLTETRLLCQNLPALWNAGNGSQLYDLGFRDRRFTGQSGEMLVVLTAIADSTFSCMVQRDFGMSDHGLVVATRAAL